MKRKSLSSLQEGLDQWSRLLGELDKLSKALDAAKGKRALREIEERMSVLCTCLLYTSPSPRDATLSRMPSSA